MIIRTIKRLKRAPVPAIAVLLFAAVVSVIICALQASNEAEVRNYEAAYQSVPVTVTVTEPSGINSDTLSISSWVLDLFTGESTVEVIDTSAAKDFNESVSLKEKTEPVGFFGRISERCSDQDVAFYIQNQWCRVQQRRESLFDWYDLIFV